MSDTATYLCIAENSVGSDEVPVSTPIWVVSSLQFTTSPTDKSLVKQDHFSLTCEVTSNPPVTMEWYADGQKLVKQNSK